MLVPSYLLAGPGAITAVAGRAANLGVVKGDDANIERYVTRKALDGLYFMIGEEEKKIRRDPIGTGSALFARVFGRLDLTARARARTSALRGANSR